ncbi:MAG: H-NS histone family protein [Marinibacterium sp.]
MSFDLTSMTSKDLVDLQSQISGALKEAVAREKSEARKAAENAAAQFGFTLEEVLSQGNARKKSEGKTVSPPKYCNPDDPSQTWTGRGRKPGWFLAAMEAGISPESLEI